MLKLAWLSNVTDVNAFAAVMMVIRTTCLRMEEFFFQVLKQAFSIKTTQILEIKVFSGSSEALA